MSNELQQAYYSLLQRDWSTASHLFSQAYYAKHGKPWNQTPPEIFWAQKRIPVTDTIPQTKLHHDIEQLEYLIRTQRLPSDVFTPFLGQWKTLYQELKNLHPQQREFPLNEMQKEILAPLWERCLYIDFPSANEPLLNPKTNWEQISWQYQNGFPGIAYADNVLSPSGLKHLYQFCLSSTIWHDFRRGGYVGSYLYDGFFHPLVLRLAEELQQKFPLLATEPLTLAWTYKYDSSHAGVGLHADSQGKMNVNFWLTPDEANLSPKTGGLELYDVLAPQDWEPHLYQHRMGELFREGQFKKITIPYQCNRMSVFNSQVFHNSGAFHFRSEYEYRRINLTLLFGFRDLT